MADGRGGRVRGAPRCGPQSGPGHGLGPHTEATGDQNRHRDRRSTSTEGIFMRPTIVLVHGAFAESSSWDGVTGRLLAQEGQRVVAAANPLRGVAADAAAVSDLVRSIEGPVVLVAHSYGGAVISNVDADAGQIVGLVYVNAFAPEPGENCFQLAGMFPGSMLGEDTARPVPRSDGTTDLYIVRDSFHDIFCQDVQAPQAALMCAKQRPAAQ